MPSSTPPSTPGAGGEIEKHTTLPHTNLIDDLTGSSSQESADHGDARIDAIQQKKPVLRFLANLESRIDRFAKFEAMGVERVPEDKRRPPQILNMIFFWFSVLFSPTMIQIGILGPILGLSVNTSIILTIFATLSGSTVPAFTATLSPMTGLRQVAVSRYSLGLWGSKFAAVLNVVINIGYATIAAILGGQLLRAVSGGSLALVVGIVIVILAAFVVSFSGYRVIHHYERYAWFFALVLICVLYGQSAKYFSPTPDAGLSSGIDLSGGCLSYFAIIFGVCASWCPIAGDYYIHYPVTTSKWLVFGLTYIGLIVPTIFVGTLGNLLGGIVLTNETLSSIHRQSGTGGLILAIMSPPDAWGKFACVFFALSFLGDTIANIYSSALCMQLLGKHFVAVPRFFWCTILSLVTFALAYGGRNVLEEIINNLLSILGYWTLAFAVILFIEHFYFRPMIGGYDLTAWQDPKRLPLGLAGTGSLLIGIGFSFLGMCQTWYIAPIAKKIGRYGGDVGDELTLISVTIAYPVLRTLELKWVGR
ncbi:Permease, cytosine/purine, uracil, thiamine, allantoin [Metarhizium guizhouense ARSEF 977]|uniref:Permease, cytosine/purine, uracil, thiamine, allantoin n=1 Tax=Metarhizium guizhouense (strain ARSEF 977) TaxID=1276136 RepID=A0A0B4GWU5_METGA|nr:Permease, cytosine/purine, uracil, thiamine, allantoin [Metarhizium guizhouense ARSEF 977]